ncbi:McrC family protein [Salegentibacter salarius]|uniref:Restriction endonuclease n=1 Tax=Salegentibacter salarius TaxID=435906 RepID=A0A2N0TWZ6_9FLAO|nr:hypothetical protein [Salegentibacter salarius]OEY72815.1 hypothetical protein BHS39_11265 [Salegentibacter salarius]PKD19275.1 hypothetical protein APR40_11245 [Salegentibacter salarius]SLJ99919.1 5-methylcytosine-specific restriction enzyme subunit McrC [Salegentibacter salarius]
MARLIRVFEHEKLTSSSRCSKGELVGTKVINKLIQYNDAHKNIYFEAIHKGVKFKNYVGVIQVGHTTIEILPKADKRSSENEKAEWHSILLKMLKKCKRIKVDSVSEAALRKRYNSLLDLYFEEFLREVNSLLNQGLVKKYRKNSGNVLALKGQINFSRNIQHNLVHQERFYTNHQVYDHQHLIHQIILKALRILKVISYNSFLQDSIERIIAKFPEVKEVEIGKHHFDRIVLNRKTTKYREALKIAKMIILNYSPDIKGGAENMLALLFDMNKLWEEYIYRMLSRLQNEHLKVSFQNKDNFWEKKVIKPDIVISQTFSDPEKKPQTLVIDTKWKIIDPDRPGDDDLKQMYVYNMYWNSQKSILLYPSSNPPKTTFGKFHKGREEDNLCKLGFVKVNVGKELDLDIGKNVLSLLKKANSIEISPK